MKGCNMKKLFVIAALTLASGSAFASKARMDALGNAAYLIDTQTMFTNPGDINFNNDFATLEFGNFAEPTYTYNNTTHVTSETIPNHAEGGFVRTLSWGKLGVYLGHKDATASSFVETGNNLLITGSGGTKTAALLEEQNPLDVFYGTEISGLKYGFGVHYSNASDNVADQKVHTAGISAGVRTDVWNASVRLGLDGESQNTTGGTNQNVTANGYEYVGGGYWFDTIYVYANYLHASAKASGDLLGLTSDTNMSQDNYTVGMVNNHKLDGGNFFYGLSYMATQGKVELASEAKMTTSSLPLVIGMELDAASWLTLRGSVTQTVLLNDVKTTANGTDLVNSHQLNNTTVAAGAGVKFNKWNLDATLAGSTTGDVNGNTLFANSSLTYWF